MDSPIIETPARAEIIYFTDSRRKPLRNVNFSFWENYLFVVDPETMQLSAYNTQIIEEISGITRIKKRQTTAT